MILSLPNLPNEPRKLATLPIKRKVHITVLTAARTIMLANDRATLFSPPPLAGGFSGLIITDVTGTVEIEWQGDLWAVGLAANATAPSVALDA